MNTELTKRNTQTASHDRPCAVHIAFLHLHGATLQHRFLAPSTYPTRSYYCSSVFSVLSAELVGVASNAAGLPTDVFPQSVQANSVIVIFKQAITTSATVTSFTLCELMQLKQHHKVA
jgi:hypothetical protein